MFQRNSREIKKSLYNIDSALFYIGNSIKLYAVIILLLSCL